jgi:hypothetical protein
MANEVGLIEALLEAIHREDELIGGRAFTRLTVPLGKDEVTSIDVDSTVGFGEWKDGAGNARVLINGEVIGCASKTNSTFDTLTRGIKESPIPRIHPEGSLVWDFSQNLSALDHLRRGLFVAFAREADLDTIARNLGLKKCIGISEDIWREFIKAIAYLPKNVTTAYAEALDVIFGPGNYELTELYPIEPFSILIRIVIPTLNNLRGKMYLNGGEKQATTGTNSVDVNYPVVGTTPVGVGGVYKRPSSTVLSAADVGLGRGGTDYYQDAGYASTTITLGATPGAAGTLVVVDYTAFQAHYLAGDGVDSMPPNGPLPKDSDLVRDGGDDYYAYLSDVTAATRCLLDQIRMAGVKMKIEGVVTI